MKVAQSRLTRQGQISVPAAVRKRLGLGPGSVLEWDIEADHVVVRRLGRCTFSDIHRAIFAETPKVKSLAEIEEGIRRHVRKRHARS